MERAELTMSLDNIQSTNNSHFEEILFTKINLIESPAKIHQVFRFLKFSVTGSLKSSHSVGRKVFECFLHSPFADYYIPMNMKNDIELVFKEAFANAVKHGHAQNVTFSGYINQRAKGDAITLIISDDGEGMTNSELEYYLRPFHSEGPICSDSNDICINCGMGFHIILKLCDKLWIQSDPATGTTITMTMVIPNLSD